jgi:hypothetical protein
MVPPELRIVVFDADRAAREDVAATLRAIHSTVVVEAPDAAAAIACVGPALDGMIFLALVEPIDDACALLAALAQAIPGVPLVAY